MPSSIEEKTFLALSICQRLVVLGRNQSASMLTFRNGWSNPSEEKSMDKYEIIIFWSEEDKVFVADVPELPGCMAHGSSYESALSNARDAITLWIKTANPAPCMWLPNHSSATREPVVGSQVSQTGDAASGEGCVFVIPAGGKIIRFGDNLLFRMFTKY